MRGWKAQRLHGLNGILTGNSFVLPDKLLQLVEPVASTGKECVLLLELEILLPKLVLVGFKLHDPLLKLVDAVDLRAHKSAHLLIRIRKDDLLFGLCLLSLDLGKQMPFAPLEVGLREDLLVLAVARLLEVVHVQLAGEGAEVTVPEVLGEDLVAEATDVLHDESAAVLCPGDHFVGLLIADDLESLRQEEWEVFVRRLTHGLVGEIVDTHFLLRVTQFLND